MCGDMQGGTCVVLAIFAMELNCQTEKADLEWAVLPGCGSAYIDAQFFPTAGTVDFSVAGHRERRTGGRSQLGTGTSPIRARLGNDK